MIYFSKVGQEGKGSMNPVLDRLMFYFLYR